MAIVQMITVDRVGGETVPVEVETTSAQPLSITAASLIVAAAKKFKTVSKKSRAYHGLTGVELTGSVELDSLKGAFIVLTGKADWKGAARLAAAHDQKTAEMVSTHKVDFVRSGHDDGDGDLSLDGKSIEDMLLEAAKSERSDGVVLVWKDTQKNGHLSNWAKSQISIDGIEYNCVEQWIMSCKAHACQNEAVREQIMATPNPRKQKGLGRSLDLKTVERCWKVHNKWDAQLRGARAKFWQHEALAMKLLRTGQKPIAEASPSDSIFGIGLAPDNPLAQDPVNWKGMNLLGKALMQVREEIQQHILAGGDLSSMPLPVPASEAISSAHELDLPPSDIDSSSDATDAG